MNRLLLFLTTSMFCLPIVWGVTFKPVFAGPASDLLSTANPVHNAQLTTLGGIASNLLPIVLTLSGLLLLLMIVWGGFQMLTSASSPERAEGGKKRLTAGIIGFLIVFASYWIVQIIQVVFGVVILN